jgi:hypothetical protein
MLNQPTLEKLNAMKLNGMAAAFREQMETAEASQLSFEERFGLLVDRQWDWKQNRALIRRLQLAKFKERGVVEDIDYQHPRGLDRKLIRTLATSDWVRQHQNLLFIGPTDPMTFCTPLPHDWKHEVSVVQLYRWRTYFPCSHLCSDRPGSGRVLLSAALCRDRVKRFFNTIAA